MRLAGRGAVVTGSSRGIGRAIALQLAQHGASVVINGRGAEAVAAVVAHIRAAGGQAIGCAGPVQDIGFAEELIERCVAEFGGVDFLINNAGTTAHGAVDRIDPATWHEVLDINLNSAFYCSRIAVRHMRARRFGRVIHCASGAAFGSIGGSVYAASKAAMLGLTYAMAADLGMYGITTNAFNPQARSRLSDQDEGGFAHYMEGKRRRGYSDEADYRYVLAMKGPDGVAPFVAYLCLDEASYINGRVFRLEGRRIGMYDEPREGAVALHDYDQHGPCSLDMLCAFTPSVFAIHNRWPQRSEAEIAAVEAEVTPWLL